MWLKTSVEETSDDGKPTRRGAGTRGTPQGGVLSPLLANIFVTPATKHPSRFPGGWVVQQARNSCLQVQDSGLSIKYLIRDRDSRLHCTFDATMKTEGITVLGHRQC